LELKSRLEEENLIVTEKENFEQIQVSPKILITEESLNKRFKNMFLDDY